jgi:16S rRNA (guanine527-N7)-methyltransferase
VEHQGALGDFLLESTRTLGFSLTEDQIRCFLVYLARLLEWNHTINLTSITDPFEIISKHFVDSLTALSACEFPGQSVVVDVGTGAGFPGIPLKLVRSDLRLTLIEPSQKKCSFLHFIVGVLKLQQVSIYTGELQGYAAQMSHSFADVIVLRALRFEEILKPAALILKPAGRLVLYRTLSMDEQPAQAFRVESNDTFTLPMNHGHRVVTVLRKVTSP